MGEQVEWFMNKAGDHIGVVAERKGEPNWSYIILRQDQTGGLRVSDVRVNFFSRTAATADLLQQMAAAEKSGHKAVAELEP
ncbi:MAG: hypothetical protein ABSC38_08120 [Verrucomicrobiia bacterium]